MKTKKRKKIKEIKRLSEKAIKKNYEYNPIGKNLSFEKIGFNGSQAHFNDVFEQVQEKMGTEVRWIGFSRDTIYSVYIPIPTKVIV